MMIAWGLADLFAKWHYRRVLPAALAGMVLIALLISTRMQISRWRNSMTLFEHTLAVTENNYLIHSNLGEAYAKLGKLEQVIDHYQQALAINPDCADAHYSLGVALEKMGKTEQTIEHYRQALASKPDYPAARENLSVALQKIGKPHGDDR